MVRVKICGVTNPADCELAAELGTHAIGLNFYPQSPRCISPRDAANVVRALPPYVASVGVFVNWAAEPIIALCKALHLSSAQLHGNETPQTCSAISQQLPIIKVFRLGKGSALPKFANYRGASAFLLDAANAGEFGGTGKATDWSLARRAATRHRIILAGGLTPENVAEAIRNVQPYAVDVASGVESRPGKKDPGKLREFFAEVARASRNLAGA
jgi:phosphoribosylanthranilate isomerase